VTWAAIADNPPHINHDIGQDLIGEAPGFDPIIHFAETPVVSSNRIGPVSISPVQLLQIGSSHDPILRQVEPVSAPDICRRRCANLHRPLRPERVRSPHPGILAMARFGAIDCVCDMVER
jgi:hypothetical protein